VIIGNGIKIPSNSSFPVTDSLKNFGDRGISIVCLNGSSNATAAGDGLYDGKQMT
jgi:hypothetical protein